MTPEEIKAAELRHKNAERVAIISLINQCEGTLFRKVEGGIKIQISGADDLIAAGKTLEFTKNAIPYLQSRVPSKRLCCRK
jgi:hypothetical protein